MTETTFELSRELARYEAEIYDAASEHRALCLDAASKRADYELAQARTVVEEIAFETANNFKRTVDVREAVVRNRVSDELLACRLAEAAAESSKEHLRALQHCLSAVQSRCQLFKTESSLGVLK